MEGSVVQDSRLDSIFFAKQVNGVLYILLDAMYVVFCSILDAVSWGIKQYMQPVRNKGFTMKLAQSLVCGKFGWLNLKQKDSMCVNHVAILQ